MDQALKLATDNRYQIECNVPVPDYPRGRTPRYPLAQMGVGDSFSVPLEELRKAATAASNYGKANNKKYTTRRLPTEGRVWRVE